MTGSRRCPPGCTCRKHDFKKPLVDGANGCVLAPSTFTTGYGRAWSDGKSVLAHRLAWESANGPIPAGYQIHHVCRNKRCMNVAHLAMLAPKPHKHEHMPTHCRQGHPYEGKNLHIQPDGTRICRACKREYAGLPELVARPCAACGHEFIPVRKRAARYCSDACRSRGRRKKHRP